MPASLEKAKSVNKLLFFGTLILFGFFIFAVRYQTLQTMQMEGKPLPPLEPGSWLTAPLTEKDIAGKPLLIFFYRPDIDLSRYLLKAAKQAQAEYGPRGLITVILAVEPEDPPGGRPLPDLPPGMFAARPGSQLTRRSFNHSSYAHYYVCNRLSVITRIGSIEDGPQALKKAVETVL